MNTPSILAEVIGAVLILTGITAVNKKYITQVMSGLEGSKALSWTVGLITFLMGAVVVALYDVWNSSWEVLVTIIGWLMIIKGAFITLFPNSSMPLYKKVANSSLVIVAGVIAIIVGLILFYLGLTA